MDDLTVTVSFPANERMVNWLNKEAKKAGESRASFIRGLVVGAGYKAPKRVASKKTTKKTKTTVRRKK